MIADLVEKERMAIQTLKAFAPKTEPYHLCYSGGKDSDVIRILASLADVPHEIHHNLTTADAPETVAYIKSIPNVIIDKPRHEDGTQITMWNLIPRKLMPPTRIVRYCCKYLKEHGGEGRLKITGVRWAESRQRAENNGIVTIVGKPVTMRKTSDEFGADGKITPKGGLIMNNDNDENRRFVEHCYRDASTRINPIVSWSDDDVWDFLHHYGCYSNPLYSCGEHRIGCIMCPLSTYKNMKSDAEKYPKYKANYLKAFSRMLEERKRRGVKTAKWENAADVMKWWVGDDPNQLTLEDYLMEVDA